MGPRVRRRAGQQPAAELNEGGPLRRGGGRAPRSWAAETGADFELESEQEHSGQGEGQSEEEGAAGPSGNGSCQALKSAAVGSFLVATARLDRCTGEGRRPVIAVAWVPCSCL